MPDITIGDAEPSDLPAITAIYEHAVFHGTASYELSPPDLTEMTARFTALRAGGFPYIAAKEGDKLLGYAYAGAFRPRPAYRFAIEDSIYLAPGAQGRGVGALLLRELIVRATDLGFRQMIAVIGDGRADSASVKLHERMGFVHSGRLRGSGFKHGRWLDTVFMQLEMNGGAATSPDARSLPERRFLGED